MFRGKSKAQITLEALNHAASRSSLGNFSPGSKARALVEAIAQVVGDASEDINSSVLSTLLPNATGPTLDLIAEAHGIQRLQPVAAQIAASDQNLRYYVRSGTFGDINGGVDIVVPAGTRIYAGSASSNLVFVQQEAVTLPAASSSVTFGADQVGLSPGVSIPVGSLNQHSFTGYTDAVFQSLLVTNAAGIAGRARETDSNLRFRVRTAMTAASTANNTALRVAGLRVPGVSDIRIVPNRAGIGSVDVVVFGISPVVSASLLQQVQEQINRVAPAGIRAYAVASRLVGISLRAILRFRSDASTAERTVAAADAEAAIRRYLNDLRPGSYLRIRTLVDLAMAASPKIIDLGTPGQPFEELLVWRQSSPRTARFSRNLTADFLILDDEDLLADPYLERPIQFAVS